MAERQLYLLKSGEIWLKGGNRPFFERMLRRHLHKTLKPYRPKILMQKGRFFLAVDSGGTAAAEQTLAKTFGLVGYSRAYATEKTLDALIETAREICREAVNSRRTATFKVESRRSDKSFPLDSYQISSKVGAAVSEAFPDLSVQMKDPDLVISVEIRDRAYLYGLTYPSPGGLPTGSAGKGLLMLSGGIDSPAAGYMMAKRGLVIEAVYFHAYPFTSQEAQEKVETLAGKLASYLGSIRLWVIPFTDAQLHIRNHAPEQEHTLHMRYAMVRLSEMLARKIRASCLITGEALSQVASQTVESLGFTDGASALPVFRPLIGLDKEDIIALARQIDTYDTSILPYDDCCTVFSSKHPLVKPDRELIQKSYDSLNLEGLLLDALKQAQMIRLPRQEPF